MRKIASHVRGHFVAYLALFFALGGTSVAAVNALPRNSVGSPQIKNGSIQKIDISKRTVSALRGLRGLRGLQGVPGPQGAQGPQGLQGATGTVDTSNFYNKAQSDSRFLGNAQIRISEQRGWLHQVGGSGSVDTYSNLQALNGGDLYYLPLETPNVIGAQAYSLSKLTICHDEDPGGKIDSTHVQKTTDGNYPDEILNDGTDHAAIFPSTECYNEAVSDPNAPAGTVYTLELVTVGLVRAIRVTATYSPTTASVASSLGTPKAAASQHSSPASR
jgi:hypothetical protein